VINGRAFKLRLFVGRCAWLALVAFVALSLEASPAKTAVARRAVSKPAGSRRASRRRAPAPVPPPTTPPAALLESDERLAPFFGALARLAGAPHPAGEDAEPEIVRVLHFGDSHTSADFWTGRVRARLQARFGDGGPGQLLPARPWRGFPHDGVRMRFDRRWPATSLRDKAGDGLVGLSGAALLIPPDEALCVVGCFRAFDVATLGRGLGPTLSLASPDPEAVSSNAPCVGTESSTLPLPELAPQRDTRTLARGDVVRTSAGGLRSVGPLELCVRLPAGERLLGVDLRAERAGLIYDELGLSGAEITDIERWDAELRQLLLGQVHASLVVLAYGANDAGRGDLDLVGFRERAVSVLERLRAESGAPVLVIGPPDRSARRRRSASVIAQSAPVVEEALRQAAAIAGCAYWDTSAAMGGKGAITRWRRAGLARRDLVHLTGPGYQRLGDLLADSLLAAFDRYAASRPGVPSAKAAP
jgi:lysophospholipase L1-like esterase